MRCPKICVRTRYAPAYMAFILIPISIYYICRGAHQLIYLHFHCFFASGLFSGDFFASDLSFHGFARELGFLTIFFFFFNLLGFLNDIQFTLPYTKWKCSNISQHTRRIHCRYSYPPSFYRILLYNTTKNNVCPICKLHRISS